jgi:hypothetical protein
MGAAGLLRPFAPGVAAQAADSSPHDAVRVNVTLNADGSRTVYEFDTARHKATATTTAANGKPKGKIEYDLDTANRFSAGRVFGPDGQFQFRTVYKYDGAGRLEAETQFGKDDKVSSKIVYSYDAAGKQTGYSAFDGAGMPLGSTSTAAPTPSASAKPRRR